MENMVKKLALLVTLTFLLSISFAGCSGTGQQSGESTSGQTGTGEGSYITDGSANTDVSDPVELSMYLVGDKSGDFDLVYEQVNKLLRDDINATVKIRFMGWGDYMQKYPLAFASGDNYDLIFTANWCCYNNQAAKGGFLEITRDMLAKYAPMTSASMYPEAWEQAKVNGKVYMLPMNYKELNSYVYLVRGDLMDKYGISAISSEKDFEEYLDAVARNEKRLVPLDIGSDMDFDILLRFEVLVPNNLDYLEPQQLNHFYNLTDTDPGRVANIIETPQFLDFIKKMKVWKERGYWSGSALVNKMTVKESFINGRSASAIMNLSTANGVYSSLSIMHPEWDIRVYDGMNGGGVAIKPYIQNGMGINVNSKNPERALMFLDRVRNDERYVDLVTYGIEGVHYEKTTDGNIKPLLETAKYHIDNNSNWGWRDDRFIKHVEGGIPNYDEIRSAWEKVAYLNPVQSFEFDDSNVKNEMEAVTSLWKTDYKVIVLGFTDNTEEDVKKLIESYKTAGNDRIIREQQKQIDAFLGSLQK